MELQDIHEDLQQYKMKNQMLHTEVVDMRNELKVIRENHLSHIQDSITKMQIAVVKTDINLQWLLKFFWITIPLIAGSLIVAIMNLVLKN